MKKIYQKLALTGLTFVSLTIPVFATSDELNESALPQDNSLLEARIETTQEVVLSSEDVNEWMPDKNFQKVVAKTLGINENDLTKEAMATLKSIDLENKEFPISNITGIEYALEVDTINIYENTRIKDFTPLEKMKNITNVGIAVQSLNDDNFPDLPDTVLYLTLTGSDITSKSLSKVAEIDSLIYLQLSNLSNITTIEPLTKSKNLEFLMMQFTGVHDFTPINDMQSLKKLLATGQNIGDYDSTSTIYRDQLIYNHDTETLTINTDLFENRLTNFDGYKPPFTKLTDTGNMYIDFNGVYVDGSRLKVNDNSIDIAGVTINDFNNLESIYFNARFDNMSGSYQKPAGFTDYAISNGRYKNTLKISERPKINEIKVQYVDESDLPIASEKSFLGVIGSKYDVTTSLYKLSIEGYTLDLSRMPINAIGNIGEGNITVTYRYKKNTPQPKLSGLSIQYVDEAGKELLTNKVFSGIVGDSYDVLTDDYKIDIAGYKLKEVIGVTSGALTEDIQTIRFVYTKNDIDPIIPVIPVDPTTPVTPTIPKEVLPNTGISNNFIMIGSFILIAGATVFYLDRSKKTRK